jgi:predicted nuclease with TOPRIM domain
MNTIKMVMVGLIVAAGAYFFYMYGEMKAAIEVHKENETKLKDGIAEQQAVIERMQADIGQIKDINSSLREKEKVVKGELSTLESKFKKTKAGDVRDLGYLATQKPDVVETMVNRGSSNVLRCFEISMGAELTKEELEATTSDKINRECSRIANPNYVQVTPQ